MSTFKELFTLYYQRHALVKLKDPANVHYWGTKHLPKWAEREAGTITRDEVQDWVDELGTKSTSAATRAVNQMSAIFAWAIKRGRFKGVNPCTGVERFEHRSRDRFLWPEEIDRFTKALNASRPDVRDLYWMFLLTGARKSNVLSMRWDEVDHALAIWRIPYDKIKNGETHMIPLAPPALAILERRKAVSTSPWVFPGRRAGSHLVEPKRSWQRLCKDAGIQNLNIHDLRRTLGSYMAINGESQYVIGKALGHRDPRSTAVYARLDLSPVRRAIDQVQAQFYQ